MKNIEKYQNTKNALAELAKRLELDIRMIEFGNVAQLKRFRKVKRIVAELAKVEYGDDGHIRYWTDTEIKLKKCRAIAEEGAEDGK